MLLRDVDFHILIADQVCHHKQHLSDLLDHMPFPGDVGVLTKSSGCKLPCSFYEYQVL